VYQECIKYLLKSWKSFLIAQKDYQKNPHKYLGKPKLPKYKKKDGRHFASYTWAGIRQRGNKIYFTSSKLYVETRITSKIQQLRIIPMGNIYKIELVYNMEFPDYKIGNSHILGIDIGVNNFATLTNNIGLKPIVVNGKIIKSINQYYNKKKAKLQSVLKKVNNKNWSNSLDKLTRKRNNKINFLMHCMSKFTINYCLKNNIATIVVGNNKKWKQEVKMGRKNNQNFVDIPYEKYINQLTYKGQMVGINVIITEESYTSKASFLDEDDIMYNNIFSGDRIRRGLYQSKNGILINADCNGSYNIIRKVFSNAFSNGIEGVHLHPVRINVY
jgi:putative transposase